MMLTLQPTISHEYDIPEDHEIAGAPFQVIRTETVLSRLPIHTLAKTGHVEINITRQNAHGQCDLLCRVSPNPTYGIPRQLAYKLDTLIINHQSSPGSSVLQGGEGEEIAAKQQQYLP